MRVVIQRVSEASVDVNNEKVSKIDKGLLILVGIENEDAEEDIDWLIYKISRLRVFDDNAGVMNLSVNDINADILLVSQFTLHASTKKGNRPSYIRAARPEIAEPVFNQLVEKMKQEINGKVFTGVFGAMMNVNLVNDGPVTIIIDSKNRE